MDAFEVSVGRMREFLEDYDSFEMVAGAGAHPNVPSSGWRREWDDHLPLSRPDAEAGLASCTDATWTRGDERLPVNCIDWFLAFAFCAWDEARLPSEAEWNYVAAGGSEQRAFPWSDPASDTRVPDGTLAVGRWVGNIQPVGSRADADGGRFGVSDLGGNVREWVLDYISESYVTPCVDCVNLVESPERARRGGDFGANALRSRSAFRSEAPPNSASEYVGVRCVRDR